MQLSNCLKTRSKDQFQRTQLSFSWKKQQSNLLLGNPNVILSIYCIRLDGGGGGGCQQFEESCYFRIPVNRQSDMKMGIAYYRQSWNLSTRRHRTCQSLGKENIHLQAWVRFDKYVHTLIIFKQIIFFWIKAETKMDNNINVVSQILINLCHSLAQNKLHLHCYYSST